jgi:IS30 family transposase
MIMAGKTPTFDGDGLFTGSRSNLTQAQRDKIIELVDDGVGRNEISRRLGIHHTTVSQITAAAGRGFADRAKTAVAVRARVIQSQIRQAEQIEAG